MYKEIVVLTGAGISAESGIPVFRSETGLWENEDVEAVCTPDGLHRDPARVHAFYNRLRRSLADKEPNPAHLALTRLQNSWPHRVTIITQNVDNLHEKAGSADVIHMHGALMSAWCTACGRHYPHEEDTFPDSECRFCGRRRVRPDIVFFGEVPYFMDEIQSRLAQASLFIAIGTSGVVYPAAGFCAFASAQGAYCVEMNLAKSAVASSFDEQILGRASQTVPKFVEDLLAG